jgi:hypothetical protein
MAPRQPRIDSCWAESLVGLRVKIPDNWWVGYSGTYLHDGKIEAFDIVNRIPAIRVFGGARLYFSLTKQRVNFTNKKENNKITMSFNRRRKAR